MENLKTDLIPLEIRETWDLAVDDLGDDTLTSNGFALRNPPQVLSDSSEAGWDPSGVEKSLALAPCVLEPSFVASSEVVNQKWDLETSSEFYNS